MLVNKFLKLVMHLIPTNKWFLDLQTPSPSKYRAFQLFPRDASLFASPHFPCQLPGLYIFSNTINPQTKKIYITFHIHDLLNSKLVFLWLGWLPKQPISPQWCNLSPPTMGPFTAVVPNYHWSRSIWS